MVDKKRRVCTSIGEDLHQKLKIKCVQDNIPLQDWLAGLIERELKNVDLLHNVVGLCPLCGSNVVEGSKSYSCSGWRKGCRFIIWKEIAKRFISPGEAARLLAVKEAGPFTGFTSKNGKEFTATLRLDDGKVLFIYEDKPKQSAEKDKGVSHVSVH